MSVDVACSIVAAVRAEAASKLRAGLTASFSHLASGDRSVNNHWLAQQAELLGEKVAQVRALLPTFTPQPDHAMCG